MTVSCREWISSLQQVAASQVAGCLQLQTESLKAAHLEKLKVWLCRREGFGAVWHGLIWYEAGQMGGTVTGRCLRKGGMGTIDVVWGGGVYGLRGLVGKCVIDLKAP